MDTLSTEELLDDLRTQQDVFNKSRLAQTLVVEKEISLKEIADAVGKHPSYISHLLRILKLPQLVVDGYYAGQISATHLMILSRLPKPEIPAAYEEVLQHSMSVSQTEELVRTYKYDVSGSTMPDVNWSKTAQKLQKSLEAKVTIYQSRVRGKIVIEKRGNTRETELFLAEMIERLSHPRTPEEKNNTISVLS